MSVFDQDIFNLQTQIEQGNIEIDKAKNLIESERMFLPVPCTVRIGQRGGFNSACALENARRGFGRAVDRTTSRAIRGEIPFSSLKNIQIQALNSITQTNINAANASATIQGANDFIKSIQNSISGLTSQLSSLFSEKKEFEILQKAEALQAKEAINFAEELQGPDFIFESPQGVLSSLFNTSTKSLLVVVAIVAAALAIAKGRRK